jgi:hypothetical protein
LGQCATHGAVGGRRPHLRIISSYSECWGWNSYGQLGNNSSGDATTWVNHDTDKDGCTDSKELGPDQLLGGRRDPTNFWDFFDTWTVDGGGYVRDKIVTSADVYAVTDRFFTDGDPNADPLATPSASNNYHPAFDRTEDPNSSESWDLLKGNGQIRADDISFAANQTNPSPHSCQ